MPQESANRISPYGHEDLRRLLNPSSIAIVGASARFGSFGERTIENLREFAGEVLYVNPRYDTLNEKPCYASLEALPVVPDCVIVSAAASEVEVTASQAVKTGAGGLIVYSSGFAETGEPEAQAMQQRLVEIVAGTRTRLIGPNCIGIFNHVTKARMSFTLLAPPKESVGPAVGLVSQSGALGTALGQAAQNGASISHILTAGNSSDVDVADLVSYLADDPGCNAIACLFEGLADPERFLKAARRAWANDKPLVVFKMATGNVGSAAAMSHTGSLAGSAEFYRAAFESVGIIQVEQPEDLLQVAIFFAKAPKAPVADGAAIISVSGGAGVIAADKAEDWGIPLPAFAPATEAKLAEIIPPFGSPRNPCDITAELLKKPEMLERVAEVILSEPDIGALIYPHPFARDGATERMQILGATARRHGKLFCTVWVSGWIEGPGSAEAEQNPDVALFRSMALCFATLASWKARAERRGREATVAARPEIDSERVAALMAPDGRKVIGEARAKAVLSEYGLPVVRERLVQGVDEAVAAGEELGFPLVAKAESPDIPHKTEAGMVILNIQDATALREACTTIFARADAMTPRPHMNGIVLQSMVPTGLELVIGGLVDPAFGPLVIFGFGGVLVELLRDSVTALAPISPQEAGILLARLSGYKLLKGYRNSPPVDTAALSEAISRVSHFIADHRDAITELDVNPLIATPTGLIAVDALIIRRDGSEAVAA